MIAIVIAIIRQIRGGAMKTIQMTIDEPLLAAVDDVVVATRTTRSAFSRDALQRALRHHRIRDRERLHATGYRQQPTEGEFDLWFDEPSWEPESDGVTCVGTHSIILTSNAPS